MYFRKWIQRLKTRLSIYCTSLWTSSKERTAFEAALQTRNEFAEAAWEEEGFDVGRVRSILQMIQVRMEWPNYYFLPNDPVCKCLLQKYDEFASYELFLDIGEFLKIDLGADDIRGLCNLGTMKELLNSIFGLQDHSPANP